MLLESKILRRTESARALKPRNLLFSGSVSSYRAGVIQSVECRLPGQSYVSQTTLTHLSSPRRKPFTIRLTAPAASSEHVVRLNRLRLLVLGLISARSAPPGRHWRDGLLPKQHGLPYNVLMELSRHKCDYVALHRRHALAID